VSGTVSGSTLHFTMTIPAGGFDAPFAGCSSTLTGDALLIASTPAALGATYSGSAAGSCAASITAGQFTLSKS
jgi:hypothetical protein